ncbi:2,3-bisphosphoglycerate-independent phosphoglycerate mutase [bacterium]|nr:2,3-bisphosphoglycerate-independent phosphoglycerate mutase [bacterium]
MKNKTLLIILDGYGEGKKYKWNAVTNAKTPNIDKLRKHYPKTLLDASGNAVGLPKGFQGGSEVGHYTIGAGKIVWQSLEEINRSIKNKKFFRKKEFKKAIKIVKKNDSKLHLMGMISDQGVHSDYRHLFELLKLAKKYKVKNVYIHAFTDGRDVPEKSGEKFLKGIKKEISIIGIGKLATMIGRFYAMDRDKNWGRTQKAYDLLTLGKGEKAADPIKALKQQYNKGIESDYYIKPIIFDKNGLIEDKDSVIFFNYRSDRASQLTDAFTKPKFNEFKQNKKVSPHFVCFGPYSTIAPVAFPAPSIKINLGKLISKKKFPQLRVAETEKYAHVTFFLNSQDKTPYPLEKRVLVPSSKVASYAEKPEMSVFEIKDSLLKELEKKDFKLVVVNFANGDLVGHSGDYKATVKGLEAIDRCIGEIIPTAQEKGYDVLLTADHGNSEYMKYANGEDCPSHTLNPVIFILVSERYRNAKLKGHGGLCDITPTILDLLKIRKPFSMSGKSLIIKK